MLHDRKESIMDTELMLDVGQANELKLAFRRHKWTNADIKKLCEGNLLGHLLPLVRDYGQATLVSIAHRIIDCDAKPFEPSGLTVAPESDQLPDRVWGQFIFDQKVKLYLSPNQQDGKVIKGTELVKELANEPVLPANVLDFYLANTNVIPAEWKGKAVFFWGTIYRGSDGGLCVRFLCFGRSGWDSRCLWLGHDWDGGRPAALCAS